MLLAVLVLAFLSIPMAAQEQDGNGASNAVDETSLVINTGDNAGEEEPEVNVSAIGLADLVRTVVVLLLVIASIYVVMLILRRFSTTGVDGSSLIKVVGSKGLMKDSSVHLLEVGNQVFLVGTGSSSVNLISEITDQETIDNIRLNLSEGNAQTVSFSQRIARNLGFGGQKKAEEQVKDAESFLRGQRDRLKDL